MWALEHGQGRSCDVTTDGDAVVVSLSGDLSLQPRSSAADLAADLLDQADSGVRRGIVDLAGVTFIDCAGVTMLLALHNLLAGRGITMVVRRPSVPVQRLLSVIELRWLIDPSVAAPLPG